MYRVLACDMDGTLLKDDKSVSDETLEALERITQKGVIFLPSTGRTHVELPEPVRELSFIHYALCCNGGSIYNYLENRYIYEDAIPRDLALKVLEYIKDLPVYETVVVNGTRIAKGDDSGAVCEYIRKVAIHSLLFNYTGAKDVADAYAKTHMDAQKMLLYLAEGADREAVIRDLSGHFPGLSVTSSGPVFIEVNVRGVDKGKALERFCGLMDIPIEESVAFGDAGNDIGMLKAAGLAVVMENGTPEARQYADMICPSNNDDGVRKAIEEIWKDQFA